MMVECILIDPPRTESTYEQAWNEDSRRRLEIQDIYAPIGLAYIAAVLRDNDVGVKIVDAKSLGMTQGDVTKMVEKERPEFVGITVVTPQYNIALQLSKKIKKACPDAKVVLGGPHIHFEHREVIKEKYIDFCVRGEGELTFLDLVKTASAGEDLARVKGITFRRRKEVVVTPDRPMIQNLDALPFPARDLLPYDFYREVRGGANFDAIVATRGCPFHCHFCAAHVMWGSERRRSVKNVLDEIEQIYKRFNVEYLRFHDDLFVSDNKWIIEFCNGMIERGLDRIDWACYGRVGIMSKEMLKAMKEANCQGIFYGIEFGNQRILDFSGKGTTIPQIYETIEMTKEAGIPAIGNFMIGYPTETKETILDTINLAKDLILNYGLDSAGFSMATPLPGTQLYEFCIKNNLLKTKDWAKYDMRQHRGGIIRLKDVTDLELMELWQKAHNEISTVQYLIDNLIISPRRR
jgi:radical SAM superfamily enzyme YgiQ (UPF0313 family)